MKRLIPALLAAAALHAPANSVPEPDDTLIPDPATVSLASKGAVIAHDEKEAVSANPAGAKTNPTTAELQAVIDRLTRNNQELLDLMDRQQKVLEDLQVDRRLQSRQIMLLEQRLQETLLLNQSLQDKVSKLQAEAAAGPREKATVPNDNTPVKTTTPATNVAPAPPPPPSSYLPAESTGGAPGSMWWHRLMLISGDDSEDSKTFHVTGKTWRVLWHNQDKPGAAYKNTSALFINAFPANDSIPRRVCAKLGSGGDSTELSGSGDYYLRIEASGGHWELAVEDFR